jgi:transcriptional regulator with XRE-family HTH domain
MKNSALIILKDHLTELNINEVLFSKKIGLELPTIAEAIKFSLSNPVKGDWTLIAKIKELFPGFNLEKFKEITDGPRQEAKAPPFNFEKAESEFRSKVANNIKNLRKSRGVSAEDMAKKTGMSATNYSAIETGRIHLNSFRLSLVSKILGVSYQTIFGESESSPETMESQLRLYKKKTQELQDQINEMAKKTTKPAKKK